MSLQITTPPTAEPVTLAEVKARLRLTTTDDDTTITSNITAAREFAEKVTRRSLVVKNYAYAMDRFPFPHEPIRVPAPPLVQVIAVKYLDYTLTQQTWDPSEYFIAQRQEPALIVPNPGLIYPDTARVPGAVEIDFTSGYGAVASAAGVTPATPATQACPEHIREGIRQLAVHIYEHPEAVTPEGLKEAPLALMTFFSANKIYVF
jgi:uncharacterized phiE125 gp8 family phage protein